MQVSTRFLLIAAIFLFISCNPEDNSKMFTLLSSNTTGITFKNVLRETQEFNVLEYSYLYNGGGIAIGDVNNDGLSDIYFTGNMVGSHLYINQGNFNFKEIAEEAGVFAEGLWNTGTTMADVNGDGFLDIYVCRSATPSANQRKNLLFINNGPSTGSGQVTFTEKGAEYGVDDSGYSTQASFFDYDKDGDLDLYVLNHSSQQYAGFGQITASLKNKKNPAFSDKLYRNDNGKFTNMSDEAGLVSNVLGFGLGVAISDINNDGWLDIYVSNDYNEQDYLYINNQNGTFSESLEEFIGHTSLFSMGSDIADVNNDGYMDIMSLDMLPEGNYRQKMVSGPDNYDKYQLLVNSGFYNQTMRNMLQLNNQGTSFSEIGQFSGISNTDWSWAALFADLDLDGYKDLFVTNGYKRDYTNMDFMNYAVQEKLKENKTGQQTAIMDLIEKIPSTVEENYTYRNKGDLTFEKVNASWGLDQKSLSNGAAYADLDNDGDLDLVVNNIDAEAFVYRNNSETLTTHNYLKVHLKGEGKNTMGIGAKVIVHNAGKKLTQEMIPTRGYQSSMGYYLTFGLGEAAIDSLTVFWPDNRVQTIQNIAPNQALTLFQKEAQTQSEQSKSTKSTHFVDVGADSILSFVHRENNFIDFKREQLLPHKLSTQGPKMAKADVNGDGLEDVFIGGAKGSSGQLFVQTKTGSFQKSNFQVFEEDINSEDLGVLFFDADNDSDMDLYVVSGGSDFDIESTDLQDRIYFNSGKGFFKKNGNALPQMYISGSSVAAGDYDADGDLDLFVGGRLTPGKYPVAPRSYILENDGKGSFTDVTQQVNPDLLNPGMVTDALWTDFNGDGKVDLIVIGEFMGVRLFENSNGILEEITESAGLKDSEGWWNTIEQADFDADGDMDYVLGNFGLNSQLKATPQEPAELYFKDFDNNGSLDPILCSYVMGESYPVFSKDDLVGQLSGLKNRYINYSDYADQKITDIFAPEELADAQILKSKNFASSYLENLGNGKFKLVPLPYSAQFAPVYGILILDFNKDNRLDLLLAGNFFGTRVKYGRYDANRGVLLLGNGNGDFNPVPHSKSGLNIAGEVRDILNVELPENERLILLARNNDTLLTYKIDFGK
ncbi:VCBS repeat-containing protein [Ulvibacterium sp.]|uniref:VCBS repeat-containing protein n=1 Tax=Ulvibacterium sp. TaxID=2665914 RepID=UPI0026062C67|nr:VCBS repeat-containing protein [Ulvibacterium sp.]